MERVFRVTAGTDGTQVPAEPTFGPSSPSRGKATLGADVDADDGTADVHFWAEKIAPGAEKGLEMKHIAGTALRVGACVVVAITGVALLAGKDDIRKFHRMRSM